MAKVLIIDDEAPFLRALSISVRAWGYDVDQARSGERGLAAVEDSHPDLVLLDLGLPGMDGMAVLGAIRAWSRVPILVLTARHGDREAARALDAGADDFLAKPFSADELAARLRALLRRAAPDPDHRRIRTDDLDIDLAVRCARTATSDVHLTATEWRLLDALIAADGAVVDVDDLLTQVWGVSYRNQRDYVRVFVAALRRKLEPDPSQPRYLLTSRGLGYSFDQGGGAVDRDLARASTNRSRQS